MVWQDKPRQRADRALARSGTPTRGLRPPGRRQPAAGPACRRGHPVHQRPCHRAAVLTVAGIAVHRPLPAKQWAGRTGPPRLGIPRRSADPSAPVVRKWLVFSSFRYAARDVLPEAAGLRRIRRVQLLLRVRGGQGPAVAAGGRPGSFRTTIPVDGRVLRSPPALPAGALPTRRHRGRRSARLPARYPRGARGLGRLLRVHHHRRRRGRPAAGHAGRDRTGRHHLGGVPHRSRPGVPPREIHAVRRRYGHRNAPPPAHQPDAATARLRRTVQRRRPGPDAAGPAGHRRAGGHRGRVARAQPAGA